MAAIAMLASSQRFHRVQPMTAVSYQVAPPSPKPPPPLDCSDLPEVHSDQGAEVPVPEVPEIHFKNALHARESAQSVSRSSGSSYQDEKTTRPVKSAILGGGVTLGLMLLTAIFLDAERFGRYTFPVRVGSAATFVGLCLVLWNLGPL
ncbi:MAG: hypothetical protein KF841_06465 [Phycisphaerae bacterium]|nr:hypothetical protein [Phycisphaerae bacterium]